MSEAINSLPRSTIIAIQFILIGIFVGIWWSGNQAQINEVKGVKTSVDMLRGEISNNMVSKKDYKLLVDEINWRFKRIEARLRMEHRDITYNN